jgi:hypothetical protein
MVAMVKLFIVINFCRKMLESKRWPGMQTRNGCRRAIDYDNVHTRSVLSSLPAFFVGEQRDSFDCK